MKYLKRSAGRILGFSRSIRALRYNYGPSRSSAGLVVELYGPVGVGKTTLVGAARSRLGSDWYVSGRLPPLDADRQAAGSVLSVPARLPPAAADPGAVGSILSYNQLFMGKAARQAEACDELPEFIQRVRWAAGRLERDYFMTNGQHSRGFVLDEGLCQSFAPDLVRLTKPAFEQLMRGRAVVFLWAARAETVVTQIKQRRSEGGHVVPRHRGRSDDELIAMVEEDLATTITFQAYLAKHGVAMLNLQAETPLEQNAALLHEFCSHLMVAERGSTAAS